MLDAQYYEKTDEIIASHTCEERSLIPIIQGISGRISLSSTGAFNLCGGEKWESRSESLQRCKLL